MTRAASRPWAGLAIIGLGAALPTLDFAVNIAFPAITEAFALPTRDIRWVAVCYVLVYSSLMLVAGGPYADYAARVGRFVPGIGRLRPTS